MSNGRQRQPTSDLLREDGHLTDLAMERRVLDDLAPDERRRFEGHVEACDRCRHRLDAVWADEQAAVDALPPLRAAAPAAVSPIHRARRWRPWQAGAGAMAAAAVLLLVLRPDDRALRPPVEPDAPGVRLKGGALAMELILDDGRKGTRLTDGATIKPGARVAFRVRVREAGWLLIVGADDAGERYLCFPQHDGWTPRRVDATVGFVTLNEFWRFDATPGSERITGLLCPHPFSRAAAWSVVDGELPAALGDCSVSTVVLRKAEVP